MSHALLPQWSTLSTSSSRRVLSEAIGADGQRSSPMLVAIDGSQASAAAVRMAFALAQRAGRGSRLSDLQFEFGRTATALAASARAGGARLIVTARRQRQDRLPFGLADIARKVLRHTPVPVLAVDARTRRIPRTAVAAIDFSMSSMQAALAALTILQSPATLYLVHVRSRLEASAMDDGRADAARAASTLAAVSRLWTGSGISVVACIRRGDPVEQTLALAREVHADLLACGQRVRPFVERVLLGSTTQELLAAAECSLLVGPRRG